jgi:hypothetical protein
MMENHPKDESVQVEDLILQNIEGWQRGQERVLRYLKALGVPPVQSLELASKTMNLAAERSVHGYEQHPIRGAMRQLAQVLIEYNLDSKSPGEPDQYACRVNTHRVCTVTSLSLPPQACRDLPAMPELKRGHMIPDMQPPSLVRSLVTLLIGRTIASKRALLINRIFSSKWKIY